MTIDFIETCREHNIKPYCLPPHTTHLLQPLDVGLFSPLQKAYGTAVDDAVCFGTLGIHKGNFLPLFINVRKAAYTKINIQNAFKACRLVPFNPCVVLTQVLNQSSNSHIPAQSPKIVATPANSSAITRLIRQRKLLLKEHQSLEEKEKIIDDIIDKLQ